MFNKLDINFLDSYTKPPNSTPPQPLPIWGGAITSEFTHRS